MELIGKREIRRDAIERRRNIDPEKRREMDIDIYSELVSLTEYKAADYVLCYVNYNDETDTHRLIRRALNDSKSVYIPKVLDPNDGEMEFFEIESLVEAEKGYHGIPEPEMNIHNSFAEVYDKLEWDQKHKILVIVPGVAFDRHLDRIGYGKGFYDRYLTSHSDVRSVGICYDCQLYDMIPHEDNDIKVNLLISNE